MKAARRPLAAGTRRERRAARSARRVGPAGASLEDAGPSTTDPALAVDPATREIVKTDCRVWAIQYVGDGEITINSEAPRPVGGASRADGLSCRCGETR